MLLIGESKAHNSRADDDDRQSDRLLREYSAPKRERISQAARECTSNVVSVRLRSDI